MVDVGVGQLRGSRTRLAARGEEADKAGDPATAGLLFFYAAECALKAELLTERQARTTAALPSNLRSHNLRALAKELNLSRRAASALVACRPRRRGHQPIDAQDLHQAWRYGAELDAADQQGAISALRDLIAACEKR